jgi:hypothetical protein
MLISNSLMLAFKNAPNKSEKQKKQEKMCKNENTRNSNSFLAVAFLGGFV